MHPRAPVSREAAFRSDEQRGEDERVGQGRREALAAAAAASEAPDRAQLRQIISGLTEGVVLVEPDGRIVWANAAALDMHGLRDGSELAATVEEYRKRFELRYRDGRVLPAHDYPFARVCRGDDFSDLVVQVTRRSKPHPDWFHRVRGFTLNDASNHPDVLVLVMTDVTETFEAEERFERMFSANPAPAVIVRVSDLRYLRVNAGFLEMTGHRSEDVVGRTVYDLDILEGAEKREIAKAQLSGWETVPQMEAKLALPSGGDKLVIVAGHPAEFGDTRCMIFTFADLEPRRRAETALRESEEQFAKSFRLAPVPMKLSTLDGHRILNVNHAFLQLTGWSYEEVIGRRPEEIELWDSSATRREVERRLTETGNFHGYELQLKTKAGELVDCLVSAETASIRGRPCVLSAMQDISDRKRTESELIAAIEAALQDTTWLSRKIMDKLAALRSPQLGRASSTTAHVDLTAREREVLALLGQGKTDAAIAASLKLSRNTVRNHVARLYPKLGVHSRSEAALWVRDHAGSLNREG